MQPPTLLWRDELDGRVRVLPRRLTVRIADALDGDLEDLEAHFRKREQSLIAVDALLHVHLRDRAKSRALQRVDEQSGLDAVAGEERDLLEQRAASTLFSRQRLHHSGQLREEQVGSGGPRVVTRQPRRMQSLPIFSAAGRRLSRMHSGRRRRVPTTPYPNLGSVGAPHHPSRDDDVAGDKLELFHAPRFAANVGATSEGSVMCGRNRHAFGARDLGTPPPEPSLDPRRQATPIHREGNRSTSRCGSRG